VHLAPEYPILVAVVERSNRIATHSTFSDARFSTVTQYLDQMDIHMYQMIVSFNARADMYIRYKCIIIPIVSV